MGHLVMMTCCTASFEMMQKVEPGQDLLCRTGMGMGGAAKLALSLTKQLVCRGSKRR